MSATFIRPYEAKQNEWAKSTPEVHVIALLSTTDKMNRMDTMDTMDTIDTTDTLDTADTADTKETPSSSSTDSTGAEADTYNMPVSSNDARQINGNIGPRDAFQKRRVYNNPKAQGKSRQVNGDVSGEAGLNFFN